MKPKKSKKPTKEEIFRYCAERGICIHMDRFCTIMGKKGWNNWEHSIDVYWCITEMCMRGD